MQSCNQNRTTMYVSYLPRKFPEPFIPSPHPPPPPPPAQPLAAADLRFATECYGSSMSRSAGSVCGLETGLSFCDCVWHLNQQPVLY